MRNLKRVLSLALAVVMVIGMMVMGAGAADFSDVAEIDYTEAVDVISALGIIEGIANGDDTYRFNPDGILTREGAAKLICYMMVGKDNAEMLTATKTFSDVASTRWSAPYISYCVSLGYIAGNGDGTFNPEGKLTGLAFAKLLLCALGYDAAIEGYVNNKNWATNIAADAFDAGLNIAGVDMNAYLTREQAAQMMLNAIKAPLVEYDTKGSSITVNGAEIVFGSSKANYVTTALAKEQRISDQTLTNTNEQVYTVEFGEKYMPGLFLNYGYADVFGRPTHLWTYRTEDVGFYSDSDLLVKEYKGAVKGSTVYRDIGYSSISKYAVEVFVDGAVSDPYTAAQLNARAGWLGNAGAGSITEVYVDHDKEEITFVHINTYLAEAAFDYNTSSKSVQLTVYTGVTLKTGAAPVAQTATQKIASKDYAIVEGMKAEDKVLVTMAAPDHDGTKGYNKYSIQSIETPDVVPTVSIDSYSNKVVDCVDDNSYYLGTVTVGADKYSTSVKAVDEVKWLYNYSVEDLKNTYNLYLDTQGNVLGIELVEENDQYVFVVGYEPGSSVLAQAIDQALIITTEGEMKTVKAKEGRNLDLDLDDDVDTDDIFAADANVNTWFKYSIDSDGVYVLEALAEKQGATTLGANVNSENVTLAYKTSHAYGNANTVYITVDADESVKTVEGSIVKVNGVYTGIKNVDIKPQTLTGMTGFSTAGTHNNAFDAVVGTDLNHAFFLYNDRGYVTHAVVVGEDDANTNGYVYLLDGIVSKSIDAKGTYYWTYPAIVDGEISSIKSTVHVDDQPAELVADTLYLAEFDADTGYVSGMTYLAETAPADWTTTTHKTNGYAVETKTGTTNPGAITLTLDGKTLWIKEEQNNYNFVVLADDCVFFVEGEQAGNVGMALAAVNADDVAYINSINVVTEKNTTGFAKTVIIDLVYKNEVPASPVASTDVVVKDIDLYNGTIEYYVEAGTYALTSDDIVAILMAQDCTNISVNAGKWSYTMKNGVSVEDATIAGTQVYKIKSVTDAAATDVVKCVADKTYAKNGDTVKITVTNIDGTAFAGTETFTSTLGSVASTFSADKKTATLTVTVSGFAADADVTVTVTP